MTPRGCVFDLGDGQHGCLTPLGIVNTTKERYSCRVRASRCDSSPRTGCGRLANESSSRLNCSSTYVSRSIGSRSRWQRPSRHTRDPEAFLSHHPSRKARRWRELSPRTQGAVPMISGSSRWLTFITSHFGGGDSHGFRPLPVKSG